MAKASIPVDLFNPGQVFACLGILEALELLEGPAAGSFERERSSPTASFTASIDGDADPIRLVLAFLKEAHVYGWVPPGSELSFGKWKVADWSVPVDPSSHIDAERFPQPLPSTPASLPALLRTQKHCIVLDSWGDATRRDNVKFWAGAGGYPGAALVRDAQALIVHELDQLVADPFNVSATMSSSLRLDWRRDYVPLGIGFSLNEHAKIQPRGYPLVEILAAIGLSNARPQRKGRRDKLAYRYGVIVGREVSAIFHRAALGCAQLPFSVQNFAMKLDWPGQEGQARCITSVDEEPTS
jgi:CRISPR-associated protein Csx14